MYSLLTILNANKDFIFNKRFGIFIMASNGGTTLELDTTSLNHIFNARAMTV